MKQILFISVFAFLFGCSSDTRNNDNDADSIRAVDSIAQLDSTINADSVSRIKLVADSVVKDTVPEEPKYKTNFRVLFTSAYCGGARPSEEILAEKNTPRLLTTSTLKFKNHFTGKEYFLKTSPDGEATEEMEEGKYDVFLTNNINPNLATGFDPKCKIWQNQLLVTVKVNTSGKTQDVNIHFVCNPCDENMKKQ